MSPFIRSFHRWVSIVFTLSVAANFVAMLFGPPPAFLTYAPLGPLFLLLGTGLFMLGKHYLSGPRRTRPANG